MRYLCFFLCVFLACGSACWAAESDALAISTNIQARHAPFGTILDPMFASATSDQIIGYTRCGDSAIWTGHYLAAEAYRYKVTASPDALTNAKKAIAGLQLLTDVTGTNLLARCAVPFSSPFEPGIASEESANGVHISNVASSTGGQQYMWIGNTSRDEYSGVFFGLGVAYDLINDAQVKAQSAALITRLLQFLIDHAWTVVMPNGSISTTFLIRPDQQLTLLQIGRHVNAAQFGNLYKQMTFGTVLVIVPIEVDDADQNSSYFKFNLDAINLFHLISNENSLLMKIVYRAAYEQFRATVADHQNPHFNMIDRALGRADAKRDADTVAYLNQWLTRPRRDPAVDLRGSVASCGNNQACNPIPIPQRVPTDFLWQRSPFQMTGGGSGIIEGAGIDYILPYWMARFYKVVTK
jgi:hypothetical protein